MNRLLLAFTALLLAPVTALHVADAKTSAKPVTSAPVLGAQGN